MKKLLIPVIDAINSLASGFGSGRGGSLPASVVNSDFAPFIPTAACTFAI